MRRLGIGERAVLFCERRQQLFELSPTAAGVWDGLVAGAPVDALAERLGVAAELCRAMAGQWMADGWLTPAALGDALARPPDEVLQLKIGELAARVELRTGADGALVRELIEVFGQFADAAVAPQLRLDVVAVAGGVFVLRDGASLGLFPRERVTPEVKAQLTEALCRRPSNGGLLLHAALLGATRGGLLLSGAPGAGKTTLAVALAARGLGYGSDDLVAVSAQAQVAGVPFSPAVKSGAWGLLSPYAPELAERPTHLRGDGQTVRYLPADRLAPYAAASLRWALLLDRREGAPAELSAVDPLTAMTALLGSAFAAEHRLAGDTLAAMAEQFAAMACFRLTYSDLGEAVGVVEELVGA